tara:strand:+ start:106 stop:279 length:174 start_codon:yes stop_codon:yes gene_type:complete
VYGLKFVQPKGDLITARSAKPWGLNNFHEAKLARPASKHIVVKINLKRAVLANIIKN